MPYEFLATARIIHLFCCIRYIGLRVSQQYFFSNRMARVSGVSGVSLLQEYQVYHCFRCAWYLEQKPSKLLHLIFGVAEFILTFVGDAVVVGQFGSWMIFVSLCLSFCEAKKGL